MKVKVGKRYVYDPVPLDEVDPPYNIEKGDIVQVVKLPGCPPPGTMGMCHVEHPIPVNKSKYAGLVCCESLRIVP